jgi:hypothetical protein
MALQKSPAPQGQGEMEKIVRSEVNYRDCEEPDKGPGGLFFFHTTHVKFIVMGTRRESASLN